MTKLVRGLGFLVLSLIIGEVVKRTLTSGPGRGLLGRVGHPELATLEGADAASKKVRQGIDFVRSLTPRGQKEAAPRERPLPVPRWVRIVSDTSEMLLATGGVLKAIADFVREDERLRKRFERLGVRVD